MNESGKQELRDLFDAIESEDPLGISLEYAELTAIDNRYERQELIGEGGMKKVWRVYDCRTRAIIAYAEPRDGLHPVFYSVMLNEAWRTASLSHPNIIKIHDTGTDGEPFFTMDLKYGDTMKKWKKRSNPSLDLCLDVFLKVCDAMTHAHSRNVLHLDLKPDNIQIEGANEVVVCDWGSGEGAGATPGYMAPEQSDVKSAKDQRTDVYGLGAILYFLLTGESSAKGATVQRVIENTAIGIEPPRSRFPELRVPRALNQIITRAMAVEPSHRYASVDKLADDIERFRTQHPTSGQKSNVITCALLFYLRNQIICNLVVLGCLAAIISGGWGIRKIEQYNKERKAERARAEQAEQMVQATTDELHQAEASINKLMLTHDEERITTLNQIEHFLRRVNEQFFFQKPYESVRMIEALSRLHLNYEPDSPVAWNELAILHFINLDFDKMWHIIRTRKTSKPTFFKLLAMLPDEPSSVVNRKSYDEIISCFGDHAPDFQQLLVAKLLVYAHANKKLSYEEMIRVYLNWLDPDAQDVLFSYNAKELQIGAKIRHPIRGHIAKMFTCEELTVTGNWPADLRDLSQSGVLHLDLTNRSIKDSVELITVFYSLESLTIKKGVYPKEELKKLHPRVKVIEVP